MVVRRTNHPLLLNLSTTLITNFPLTVCEINVQYLHWLPWHFYILMKALGCPGVCVHSLASIALSNVLRNYSSNFGNPELLLNHLDCSLDSKVSSVFMVHGHDFWNHGFWYPDFSSMTDNSYCSCFRKLPLPISGTSQMGILPPSRITILSDCKMREQAGFHTGNTVAESKWIFILCGMFESSKEVRSSRQCIRYQILSACLVVQAGTW